MNSDGNALVCADMELQSTASCCGIAAAIASQSKINADVYDVRTNRTGRLRCGLTKPVAWAEPVTQIPFGNDKQEDCTETKGHARLKQMDPAETKGHVCLKQRTRATSGRC